MTLEEIRDRLYREDRLSGDQMRDMAQAIDAVISREREEAEPPARVSEKPIARQIVTLSKVRLALQDLKIYLNTESHNGWDHNWIQARVNSISDLAEG